MSFSYVHVAGVYWLQVFQSFRIVVIGLATILGSKQLFNAAT